MNPNNTDKMDKRKVFENALNVLFSIEKIIVSKSGEAYVHFDQKKWIIEATKAKSALVLTCENPKLENVFNDILAALKMERFNFKRKHAELVNIRINEFCNLSRRELGLNENLNERSILEEMQ